MKRRTFLALPLALALPGYATDYTLLDQCYQRMYNFDFVTALQLVDQYTKTYPADPLGPATRAAALLFRELDRLQILQTEFFTDDDRIAEKKKLKPDVPTRDAFYWATQQCREISEGILAKDANNKEALFALAMSWGLLTDYAAFIEKRQLSSLSFAKTAHGWALKLLAVDKTYYDAYLSTGISEYLLGSLPFFVKWFVKFEQTKGSKQVAVDNLKLVASKGRLLGPFARILLAVVALREKRPNDAKSYLTSLVRDFPENPLLKAELKKLS